MNSNRLNVLPELNTPVIRTQTPLICLISLNTALLVASSAAGAKLITVTEHWVASATVFSYAFSFLLTDLISELYGKKAAKIAVNIGFGGLFLSVIIFLLSIHATPATFWPHQDAYQQTLGQAPRILIGGWLAYLVGQNIDLWIYHTLKKITHNKYLWLRNNASTMISQLVDSIIFITVAFYGVFPILEVILGQYLIKLAIATIDTPLLYIAVKLLKKKI